MRYLLSLMMILLGSASLYAYQWQDPTRPVFLSQKTVKLEQLQLTAILISPIRRVAVINDVSVQVGDIIGNAKVVSIEPNTVQLEGPVGRIKLILLNNLFKQPVNVGQVN